MLDYLMCVHHPKNGGGDLWEVDLAIHERIHGDFVGGIEHGGHRAAGVTSTACEVNGGKTICVWFLKCERAELREICLHAIACGARGVGERVLNWQAHVRRGE